MPTADTLKVLHITDLHLRSTPDGELYQVRTNKSFSAVLKRALADPEWSPGVILVTGDVAEDATEAVYRGFHAEMQRLGLPVLCLPGNHDDPKLMMSVLDEGNLSVCASRSFGRWRLVLLDSVLPGEAGGLLSTAELRRLESELNQARDQWVTVALHHQPLAMGSAWLDDAGLANGGELLALLARHPHVRLVAWGHVHQESDRLYAHMRLISTPSTCAQFTPNTPRCLMDTRPPGFRRLQLGTEGEVTTTVQWLEDWTPTQRPADTRGSEPGRATDWSK